MFLQLFHLWEGQWAIHQEKVWHWLMHSSCSSSRWRLRMQFVCHECQCALWTCAEDCKDRSLGTGSDSHAILLNEGQRLLLTLGAFWACHGKAKRKRGQSHIGSAECIRVKRKKRLYLTTSKFCNSNSFFVELRNNRAQQFWGIYSKQHTYGKKILNKMQKSAGLLNSNS